MKDILLTIASVKRYNILDMNRFIDEKHNGSLLASIVEHAPVACFVLDEAGEVEMANQQACVLVGLSKEDILGNVATDLIQEDGRNVLEQLKLFLDAVSKQGSQTRVSTVIRRDGRQMYIEVDANTVICSHGNTFFILFAKDITERFQSDIALRESEMRYRHIFDNADDMIYTLDEQGYFTTVNRALLRFSGYTLEEVLGHSAGELGIITGTDYEIAANKFENIMQGKGDSQKKYSFTIRGKSGNGLLIEVSASALYHERDIIGMQGIARDITKQKEYEMKLFHLNQELEIQVEQRTRELQNELDWKNQFLGDVSHELRTPLTIMSLALEELKECDDKESEESKCILRQEVRRLDQLIEGIFLLVDNKFGEDGFPLHDSVDFSELVFRVIHRLESMIASKNITILMPDVVCKLTGNAELLERIVTNLLTNAIKYSYDMGKIDLGVFMSDTEVVFEVQDYGIGIPHDKQRLIFERFYRVDHSRERMNGGIGLGLAIVKWAVEKHGGLVEVESEEGKGALFRVHIPRISLP